MSPLSRWPSHLPFAEAKKPQCQALLLSFMAPMPPEVLQHRRGIRRATPRPPSNPTPRPPSNPLLSPHPLLSGPPPLHWKSDTSLRCFKCCKDFPSQEQSSHNGHQGPRIQPRALSDPCPHRSHPLGLNGPPCYIPSTSALCGPLGLEHFPFLYRASGLCPHLLLIFAHK